MLYKIATPCCRCRKGNAHLHILITVRTCAHNVQHENAWRSHVNVKNKTQMTPIYLKDTGHNLETRYKKGLLHMYVYVCGCGSLIIYGQRIARGKPLPLYRTTWSLSLKSLLKALKHILIKLKFTRFFILIVTDYLS